MNSSVFGLDIGTTTLKAVWLSKEKDKYAVKSVLVSGSTEKGMRSESPIDEEEIAKKIKTLVTDAKIGTRKVNIALGESQVYTKVITMPLLSDKELASAIYWEAEQYIPVPLTDITLDYKVLKKPEKADDSNEMTVLLVGAPTRLIEKYERVMSMAGLSIFSIETEILATVRSVIIDDKFPVSLIINIGTVSSSIAIVKNGIVIFVYSVQTGSLALTRAIAADLGFSLDQADQYKKTYGISEESFGGKIGKATQPILMSIITEVKKSLTFYEQKYPYLPIKPIILSGATARLLGLDKFFVNNLGIETVVANPWKIIGNQQLPKEIMDNAPEYTVAVGLAMREYD